VAVTVGATVLTVASLDPVLPDVAVGALLCDLPGSVGVGYDLGGDGLVHRWVAGRVGDRTRQEVPVGEGCVSCAVGTDLVRVLTVLATQARPPVWVVLALPPAMDPGPRVAGPAPAWTRFGPVLAVLDGDRLEDDVLGGDLLVERGLAVSGADRRGVGEAVAHALQVADVLVTPAGLTARTRQLVDHLAGPIPDCRLHDLDPASLHGAATGERTRRRVLGPATLRLAAPTGAVDRDGVWTLDLDSRRPLHPHRLQEGMEALAQGRVYGRGRLWLATRPDQVIGWEGAGGQLGIGVIGRWGAEPARTRLVITGTDGDPDLHRLAFQRALLSDAELSRGLDWWAGRDDGFAPWLGPVTGRDHPRPHPASSKGACTGSPYPPSPRLRGIARRPARGEHLS
jgi:G3E family GTPase